MAADDKDRLSFDAFMRRVQKGARIRSQNQLAGAPGIHRSAVTQAKRRDSVPRQWAYRVAEAFDLDLQWLLTGKKDGPLAGQDDLVWVSGCPGSRPGSAPAADLIETGSDLKMPCR